MCCELRSSLKPVRMLLPIEDERARWCNLAHLPLHCHVFVMLWFKVAESLDGMKLCRSADRAFVQQSNVSNFELLLWTCVFSSQIVNQDEIIGDLLLWTNYA